MAEEPNLQIEDLLHPDVFPHPVGSLQLEETHSAWVILTGEYAYKIKKPVDFGFLDFSTLERRKHFCEEELRLNRRLAPELYEAMVPVTKSSDGTWAIDGKGAPLEWAIRMKQFSQRNLLSRCIRENRLTAGQIDQLADLVAQFHQMIERTPASSEYGTPETATSAALENFPELFEADFSPRVSSMVRELHQWTKNTADQLTEAFESRKANGFVRECHGDLHLNNMFLDDSGNVTIFDGIEFNPKLRWIDVMSDLAFCLMDLQEQQRNDFCFRLLNRYLEKTGDYEGLKMLRFYQVYRAMVRAKVCQLRLNQQAPDSSQAKTLHDELLKYLTLARQETEVSPGRIFLTCGLSGSGKSAVSQQFLESDGLIRIRSDIERKRIIDGSRESLYSPSATARTYERLLQLGREILKFGYSVIVDATFLRWEQREPFLRFANAESIPLFILHCRADEEVLRQRITGRRTTRDNVSDADLDVLNQQIQTREAFSEEERKHLIELRTDQHDLKTLVDQIDHEAGAK